MKHVDEFEIIRGKLKKYAPPHDILLIREVANLDWGNLDEGNIEAGSEILLRISADAIICASDMKGISRENYREALLVIAERIRLSDNVDISEDFREFFKKYVSYLSDFDE